MKIVLFSFHENRVRSIIQRMPDMLAHIEKGEIVARPKRKRTGPFPSVRFPPDRCGVEPCNQNVCHHLNGQPTNLIDRLQCLSEQKGSGVVVAAVGLQETIKKSISSIVDVMLIGFVVLTSVICLLNLFNSIRGWILESRQEFAVLQPVGMAGGQMRKMLLYECMGIFLWTLLQAGVFSGLLICGVRFGLTRIFGTLVLPTPLDWDGGCGCDRGSGFDRTGSVWLQERAVGGFV